MRWYDRVLGRPGTANHLHLTRLITTPKCHHWIFTGLMLWLTPSQQKLHWRQHDVDMTIINTSFKPQGSGHCSTDCCDLSTPLARCKCKRTEVKQFAIRCQLCLWLMTNVSRCHVCRIFADISLKTESTLTILPGHYLMTVSLVCHSGPCGFFNSGHSK